MVFHFYWDLMIPLIFQLIKPVFPLDIAEQTWQGWEHSHCFLLLSSTPALKGSLSWWEKPLWLAALITHLLVTVAWRQLPMKEHKFGGTWPSGLFNLAELPSLGGSLWIRDLGGHPELGMDYLRGISKTFWLLLSNTSTAVVGNDFLCLKLRFYKVILTAMFSSVVIYKVLPASRHQPIDSQLLKNNLEALHITLQRRKGRRGLEIWVTMQKFFLNVRIQA